MLTQQLLEIKQDVYAEVPPKGYSVTALDASLRPVGLRHVQVGRNAHAEPKKMRRTHRKIW